jgi:hypothetical protein
MSVYLKRSLHINKKTKGMGIEIIIMTFYLTFVRQVPNTPNEMCFTIIFFVMSQKVGVLVSIH